MVTQINNFKEETNEIIFPISGVRKWKQYKHTCG